MKTFLLLVTFFLYSQAVDLIKLPSVGVEVIHTYSDMSKEKIKISREIDYDCYEIAINAENFQSENLASSKIDKLCKKTFITTKGLIQPMHLKDGVKTLGELEVLDFIKNKSSKIPSKYILVDSRTNDWFDSATIPSSINIPYNELIYDEDFEEEYINAFKNLGVKVISKGKYDFSKAKTAVFFCNGAWCAQSPRAIKNLIKIGYPVEKINWYRGGIQAWAGVSLSLTKNIEAKK